MDRRLEASKFDPCSLFVYSNSGSAAGATATHIDDLLGRGEHGILQKMEKFLSATLSPVKVQTGNFAHIGVDVPQKVDGSVEITQKDLPVLLRPTAASPSPWRDRNRPLSDEELCWLATMARPDICARLARFSANLSSLQVIDVYRINDLIKTVKQWRSECTLKYFAGLPMPARRSLSCPDDGWGRPRPIHEGAMTMRHLALQRRMAAVD